MKHKSKLQKLHGADDPTIDRITAQTPPDWDMEQTFEKSYRKYLAQSGSPAAPPPEETITAEIKPARSRWMGILMTAACMAIACGTVGTMYFLHRSAPARQSMLEAETQTVTAAETAAETAPAESEALTEAPEPTAPAPAVMTVPVPTEAQTDAAQPATDQPVSTQPATSPQTKPPAQNTVKPTEPAAAQPPTDPVSSSPPEETAPAPIETSPETSAAVSPITAPEFITEPASEGLPFTQPEDTVFRIERKGGGYAFNGAGPKIPLSDDLPETDLDGWTIEEPFKGDVYANHYNIRHPDIDSTFQVHRFLFSGFYCEMPGDKTEACTIQGREAYHSDCYLIWNDGGGISLMTFAGPDLLDTALELAEHLNMP